ncbi:MAG: aminoacylase [Bacteroidetes bacterium]|nr:aminoacylase [Bacteroidota bacterium]
MMRQTPGRAARLAPTRPGLRALALAGLVLVAGGCSREPAYDVVIRNGTIYDGAGRLPFRGDLAIRGDTIAAMGQRVPGTGRVDIDARGLAVAPGFINMLSWANESLIQDGRSESDIRQGVTLEVFGEGESMGPLNDRMKEALRERQGDIRYEIEWTTLGEYLSYLERRGVSPNVASFVGATTVRIHELGYENRAPNPTELGRMKQLVRKAMEEGAFGVGSSLIYAPAFYARTDELIALAGAAAPYGGMYISHIRGEGAAILGAVDELVEIARAASVPSEIYHLKAAGRANWHLMDQVLAKIEDARSSGLAITADMYTYTAAATGLDAAMPPWVQEGGFDAWTERLRDPLVRSRVAREMSEAPEGWENLYYAAGSADRLLLVGFRTDSLKYLTGKTLAEVASMRRVTPEVAAMDLVVQDNSRVDVVYFLMSEENLRAQVQRPWVSFGSDAASMAPEGVFLRSQPHPRTYGNVARLLGKYVREEKLISLHEAVRRLTGLPASNLGLDRRGLLRPGYFADVVVFDPGSIADHATFDRPHQYATGVRHVFVNGAHTLRDGEHTGVKSGRAIRKTSRR